MTDGERLTAILAQYAIPCEKVSFRGWRQGWASRHKGG